MQISYLNLHKSMAAPLVRNLLVPAKIPPFRKLSSVFYVGLKKVN